MKPKAINIHIERLVLDGLEPVNRRHLEAAVGAELSRLLCAEGVPPSLAASGHMPHLDAGVLPPASGRGDGHELGTNIGRQVYKALR